ncbi:rhamnogalacturonan acetylesterase [uncultured Cedecea sp.]|uniref:rhamnogalacturonan acetylesterase n=1 Tax=uncultured Cedecea sp. TaxID=988762 RepID=UPI00260B65CA|nr:rhamnogalacturonan acetylesterase [uncultured Cedecea sp.]
MRHKITMVALMCSLPSLVQASAILEGIVLADTPFKEARVQITDSRGERLSTDTNSEGRYRLPVDGLVPPLVLSAIAANEGDNCLYNNIPRARCMASLVLTLNSNQVNTGNITPFSDRMVSEAAGQLGYIGPQQFVENVTPAELSQVSLTHPLANFRQGMADAFALAGEDISVIDPVSTPVQSHDAMTRVLAVINTNRGYHNNTGQAGHVTLTDSAFRPITGLNNSGAWEPFLLERAEQDKQAITKAQTRVLIVSDSTAASYEVSRLPRMGWGQVFQESFRPDSGVVVLNGARAGRASRDFYNGGWYQQMGRYLQPGDYVFIAHGHNDQNCNSKKPVRGAADVANLCSYPNDSQGRPQYPEGQPELSFQHSLERYIKIARDKGAIPILFTPTTRVKNSEGKTAFQQGPQDKVVSSHYTSAKPGYLFSGDYIATIKQTAVANQVPLIDLEQATIEFANAHADDWMDYWLAVDANDPRYPWYKTQKAGIRTAPDTTHFQEKGARAVADLVVEGIKNTPELQALSQQLNP